MTLREFIKNKIENYQEPQRRGTPRGEAVGLSRVKYHASLWTALTSLSEKQIAQRLRISYGLLLKWRTEAQFQYHLPRHVSGYCREIRREVDNRAQALSEALRAQIGGKETGGISLRPWNFEDADDWSVALVVALCRMGLEFGTMASELGDWREGVRLLELLRAIRALERQKKVYFQQSTGRPKNLPRASSILKEFNLAEGSTELACQKLFAETIQRLEVAILETASWCCFVSKEPEKNKGPGYFLLKALANDKGGRNEKVFIPLAIAH